MAEAFKHNADIVEIDVHATAEGQIVVFHDWRLECRTDGAGVTEEKALAYLRSLDIGYGYTSDGHRTHPFRCVRGAPDFEECRSRNQMPLLAEVLKMFPTKRFAVNMKSGRPETFRILVSELKRLSAELGYDLRNLAFYCSKEEFNALMRKELPENSRPNVTDPSPIRCLSAASRSVLVAKVDFCSFSST